MNLSEIEKSIRKKPIDEHISNLKTLFEKDSFNSIKSYINCFENIDFVYKFIYKNDIFFNFIKKTNNLNDFIHFLKIINYKFDFQNKDGDSIFHAIFAHYDTNQLNMFLTDADLLDIDINKSIRLRNNNLETPVHILFKNNSLNNDLFKKIMIKNVPLQSMDIQFNNLVHNLFSNPFLTVDMLNAIINNYEFDFSLKNKGGFNAIDVLKIKNYSLYKDKSIFFKKFLESNKNNKFDNDINKNVFGNNQLVITKISNSNHLKEKLKVFNERTRYRNTINLSKYYCY